MKIFDKIINWCFEEKKEEKVKIEQKPFYIPCNKFYNLTELKERKAKTLIKN